MAGTKAHRDVSSRAALGIAVVALLLRVWLIDFPTDCHPDERIIGKLTQRAVERGELTANWDGFEHDWWSRPTYQFSPYTLTQSAIARVVHWSTGWPSNLDGHILLARFCSCLWGAAAVFLVFLLSRACFSSSAALWSESVMATCFVNIQDSIYARVDTFLCFFVLLSLLLAVRAMGRPGDWKWLSAAALSIGVTVAAKYNALPIVAMIPCIIFRWAQIRAVSWKKASLIVVASLLMAAIGFLVATPELLSRTAPFLAGLQYEREHYRTGHLPHQAHDWSDNNLFYWLSYLAELGFGYLPLPFCLCFPVRLIKWRRPEDFMLTVYLFASITSLLVTTVRFERNLELCIGLLAVVSGAMAASLLEWVQRKPAAPGRIMCIAFVALWFVQPLLILVHFRQTLNYPREVKYAVTNSPGWRSQSLWIPAISREPKPDVFAYQNLFLVDFGDEFSADAVKRWSRFIGTPPAYELRSPWSWYGYPFSTVDMYHGPFRVFVFRKPESGN